jgi:hypothetical protein
MAPPSKFPRRYTQRQSLRIQNTASSRNVYEWYRIRISRKRRLDNDKGNNLSQDSDVDTDEENKPDLGYTSNSDIEAEYLNGLVEKFRKIGPQISNLGDVA